MLGFLLAVGFGRLYSASWWAGRGRSCAGLYPLMIGFNAIPKVAVVPILVLWFGIGFIPAVAHRVPDLVLSDRRQCRDRACDHRART